MISAEVRASIATTTDSFTKDGLLVWPGPATDCLCAGCGLEGIATALRAGLLDTIDLIVEPISGKQLDRPLGSNPDQGGIVKTCGWACHATC